MSHENWHYCNFDVNFDMFVADGASDALPSIHTFTAIERQKRQIYRAQGKKTFFFVNIKFVRIELFNFYSIFKKKNFECIEKSELKNGLQRLSCIICV